MPLLPELQSIADWSHVLEAFLRLPPRSPSSCQHVWAAAELGVGSSSLCCGEWRSCLEFFAHCDELAPYRFGPDRVPHSVGTVGCALQVGRCIELCDVG